MLRNFATIGFVFLSIGQLSAETISTQNASSPTSIKEALSQYLDERSKWGPAPSQTSADIASQNSPLTLAAYLARRDTWNRSASRNADEAPDTAGALQRYLAQRDSWGTAPAKSSSDTMLAAAPLTLAAYLARRDAWNASVPTAHAAADTAGALERYLARRDSWGSTASAETNPHRMLAATPLTLQAYLARREAWSGSAATTHATADTASALKRYLARRDSWGDAPGASQPQITHVQLQKALQEHLSRRQSWGTGSDGQERNTRVATATFRNGRNDSSNCMEAVQEIIGSSVIQFSFGSAALTTQSRRNLKRLADTTRSCPDIRIRVEGHTDSAGNAESNQRLSEARAASVANYLTTAGINEADLEAIGYGQTRPLVSNATSALRAQNRRIEFTVLAN